MIRLGMDAARELAPVEYLYHREASEGSLRRAAELREFSDAPAPLSAMLRTGAQVAIDLEGESAARLELAVQSAMRQRISELFRGAPAVRSVGPFRAKFTAACTMPCALTSRNDLDGGNEAVQQQ